MHTLRVFSSARVVLGKSPQRCLPVVRKAGGFTQSDNLNFNRFLQKEELRFLLLHRPFSKSHSFFFFRSVENEHHCPPGGAVSHRFTTSPVHFCPTSDPLLHGAFAVQYVPRRALPFELDHRVDQDEQTQGQDAGDDDGDSLDGVRLVLQFDYHV